MINELKQRSPFGSVPSFANTDKEPQRNGLPVIYGNRSSGVMINCIKKYQSLSKPEPVLLLGSSPLDKEEKEDEEEII